MNATIMLTPESATRLTDAERHFLSVTSQFQKHSPTATALIARMKSYARALAELKRTAESGGTLTPQQLLECHGAATSLRDLARQISSPDTTRQRFLDMADAIDTARRNLV